MFKRFKFMLKNSEGRLLTEEELAEQLPSVQLCRSLAKAKKVIYPVAILIFFVVAYLLLFSPFDFYTVLPIAVVAIVIEAIFWGFEWKMRKDISFWSKNEVEIINQALDDIAKDMEAQEKFKEDIKNVPEDEIREKVRQALKDEPDISDDIIEETANELIQFIRDMNELEEGSKE